MLRSASTYLPDQAASLADFGFLLSSPDVLEVISWPKTRDQRALGPGMQKAFERKHFVYTKAAKDTGRKSTAAMR
jgi:hypothetical protein